MERARDADPAEDERDESHEAQEAVQVGERLAEVALALLDRLEAEAKRGELLLHVPDDRVGVLGFGQPDHRAEARQRPGPEEACPGEGVHRDVRPGRHHRDSRRLARDLPQGPDDGEEGFPEPHLVADPDAELGEERRLEEDDGASGTQARGGALRVGLERPVEREGSLDGADLDEPEVPRSRECHHRREHLLAGDLAAEGAEVVHHGGRQRGRRRDEEVRPEEALGLRLDRLADVGAEGPDRDQGRDPEDDRERVEEKAPP